MFGPAACLQQARFVSFQGIHSGPCGPDGIGGCVLAVEFAGHGQAHGHALPDEFHGAGLALFGTQVEVADPRLPVEGGDIGGGHAGARHQVDAVGGEAAECLQILKPLGGGGHLAGGQDGLDAKVTGGVDGLKGVPAHVEAAVERHLTISSRSHAPAQEGHVQVPLGGQGPDDHAVDAGPGAEFDLLQQDLLFLVGEAEITEPGPQEHIDGGLHPLHHLLDQEGTGGHAAHQQIAAELQTVSAVFRSPPGGFKGVNADFKKEFFHIISP